MMHDEMKSSGKHIELIDYFRGIAIIAVLLFHTMGNVFGYDALPWNGSFRDFSVSGSFLCFFPITFAGQAGVPIFFVVSGFCIHISFKNQGCRWNDFFIRRSFRIYPAYLAALFFSILIIMCQTSLSINSDAFWMQFLTHLFFIHNFQASTLYSFAGAFWSLAVEVQLYLLYPVLLWLVTKLAWRRALMLLAGCELFIHAMQGFAETFGLTDTLGGRVFWLLSYSPLGFWFGWATGAWIADAFLTSQPLPFAKNRLFVWLGLAFICYLIKPLVAFQFLMFALAAATLISRLLSKSKDHPQTVFWKTHFGWIKKTGLWSYSIYLLHQPLLQIYSTIIYLIIPYEYRPAPITFLLVAATWVAVIPFSILWYKIFEAPGIVLGKIIIKKTGFRRMPKTEPVGPQLFLATARGSNWATVIKYTLMGSILLVMVGGTLLAGTLLVRNKPASPTPVENIDRAWALATDSQAAGRNGPLAVKLAEDACQRTHYQESFMVGTLAAAYAEAGRFEDAISTAQQACALAAKNGDTNLLQRNQELLALYQNHQPYHKRQGNPP